MTDLLDPAQRAHLSNSLGQALDHLTTKLGFAKAAEVTQDRAARALDRLDTLERSKPTGGQVARYSAIGGAGGMLAGAVGNAIESYKPSATPGLRGRVLDVGRALVRAEKNPTVQAKVRSVASMGAKGAIGGGAIPLMRAHSDQSAERKVLQKYVGQNSQ